MSSQNLLAVRVGELLFEFTSLDDWRDTAQRKFRSMRVGSYNTISIDMVGRLCPTGRHFMRAEKENQFPVKVYLLDCEVESCG
jgi:hypothetical protein